MLAGTSGISKYMEMILNSEFQNAHLLTADEFIKYLEDMEIYLSKERLEFYDEKGLLRPALRYKEPNLKGPNVIRFVNGPIIIEMQQNCDMVEFPKDNDYRPWSEYATDNEKTIQYYHPFQFIPVHKLDRRFNKVLGPKKLEALSEITKEELEKWKKNLAHDIETSQKAMVDAWIPRIGLLMLLEEPAFARNLGIELLDPDDYCDGDKGSWKTIAYGEPFDYRSSKTQMRIRDRFFKDRPYRIVIIVEGLSEEKAIKMIFKALYVDERKDGIMLYTAHGQGNMEANLEALFEVVKRSDIEVFEIVDGEKDSKEMLAEHEARGIIKSGMSKAWDKDFEYDNFGTKRVVEKIAELLRGKVDGGILTVDEVEEKMKNGSVLMNAISAVTNSKYGMKVDDIVKKPELTEMLM